MNPAGTRGPGEAWFAASYAQARERFRAAANAAGAALETRTLPGHQGPEGEPLCMDWAWLGPADADTVVLCLSGVHGAEGYAGSAVQAAWLVGRSAGALPAGTAVMMVHAVNPFGFAWGLRATEDNIDLNRNWLDHDIASYPDNPLYEALHPYLCPKDLSPGSIDAMLRKASRLIEKHGQWALEDAISRGQYAHPDGFHFGGRARAWSTHQLQALAKSHLSRARQVAYVDFHTGPIGNGERIFLCFSRPGSEGWRRAEAMWGHDAVAAETVTRQWGARRPTRNGIIFWGLEDALAANVQVAGAIVEFCSSERPRDARRALRIPMLERWLRFEGGFDAPEAPAYLAEIRHHYAPRRRAWEEKVLQGGLETLDAALAGSAGWQAGAQAAD